MLKLCIQYFQNMSSRPSFWLLLSLYNINVYLHLIPVVWMKHMAAIKHLHLDLFEDIRLTRLHIFPLPRLLPQQLSLSFWFVFLSVPLVGSIPLLIFLYPKVLSSRCTHFIALLYFFQLLIYLLLVTFNSKIIISCHIQSG